jgi:hypothetical protein
VIGRWPGTYAEAVRMAVATLSDEEAAGIRALSRQDLGLLHFGLGLTLKNRFGLWPSNQRLIASCAALGGPLCENPDAATALIIEGVWIVLQAGVNDPDQQDAQAGP